MEGNKIYPIKYYIRINKRLQTQSVKDITGHSCRCKLKQEGMHQLIQWKPNYGRKEQKINEQEASLTNMLLTLESERSR